MKSGWLGSGAEERIRGLLERAGIPLEIKVRSICNKFCQSKSKLDPINVSTEKVVYAPSSSEEKYREIDQRVQIYDEFKVGELGGIQLMVNLPVECKYRVDIEAFGFATPSSSGNICEKLVISGSPAGSTYFSCLHNSYSCLSELHPFDIVLAKIKGGITPESIHGEKLIYNAAGSLYDFILFDLEDFRENVGNNPTVDELFEKFQNYLREHQYYWRHVLRRWIVEEISSEQYERFNQKYFGDSHLYHTIIAYLPIVCINGPLYHVVLDSELNVEGFKEVSFLATSIRKQGWPGLIAIELLCKDPVVPVVVTNPSGLNNILEIGFEWYQMIKNLLQVIPRTIVRRWPLESAFFRKVYNLYAGKESSRYRSDLDSGV